MMKIYKMKMQLTLMLMCFIISITGLKAQVDVTATAGTLTASYTTLNAAFVAINAGTHKGVVSIAITGNTTEPAIPNPLLKSGTGSSLYTAINITPLGGDFTINSAAAPTTNRGIIELAGADNVTIDGDDLTTPGAQNLSIVAAPVATAGIACIRLSSNSVTGTDGADNNTIKNCIITGSRSSAIATNTCYGIQFSNGVAASSSATGAYMSINTTIQNNIITRCFTGIRAIGNSATFLNANTKIIGNVLGSDVSADNIGQRGIIITFSASVAGVGSAQISGNDIRVGDYGATGYAAGIAGIEIGTVNAGCVINANNIHDINQPVATGSGAQGITITGATSNSGIIITNNFIRDCKMVIKQTAATGTTAIPCGILFGAGATNVILNHNTIVMNDQLFASATFSSFCVDAGVAGVTFTQFLNNILVNNHTSTNSFCFYTGATTNISTAAVDNNNYYNPGGNVGYYNTLNVTTLTAWQAATTKDVAALNINPPFTSSTDLHIPTATVTLLESGGASFATTGITTDIDADTRQGAGAYAGTGTAPDIGADEFDGAVPSPCAGTPASSNTLSSAVTACTGVPFNLSLSVNYTETGFTYQWQSSPDGLTYSNVIGSTANTATVSETASTYYQCIVTCSNGMAADTSTALLVPMSFINCYCSAGLTTTGYVDDVITNVSLTNSLGANFTQNSGGGAAPWFTSYNNTPLDLYRATSNTVAITVGADITQHTAAWADWNQDGVFSASENIALSTVVAGGGDTVIYTFTVPANAVLGNTRIRVRGASDNAYTAAGACAPTAYGETEDYLINIVCPVIAAPLATGASICAGNTASLTAIASLTGTTLTWFDAAVAGTILGTGSPYTPGY
jgi:hypothetical protein